MFLGFENVIAIKCCYRQLKMNTPKINLLILIILGSIKEPKMKVLWFNAKFNQLQTNQ